MHAKVSQGKEMMKKSKLTLGIICPVPIEYKAFRDVLKLSREKRLMGRLVSSQNDLFGAIRGHITGNPIRYSLLFSRVMIF